jgi:hypothetical protein
MNEDLVQLNVLVRHITTHVDVVDVVVVAPLKYHVKQTRTVLVTSSELVVLPRANVTGNGWNRIESNRIESNRITPEMGNLVSPFYKSCHVIVVFVFDVVVRSSGESSEVA